MSGPGGATTKRDQRRDARRQQLQQRQLERQRERARQIRTKRIRQGSLIGGAVLLVLLLAVLLSVFVFHIGGASTHPPAHPSGQHGGRLAPLARLEGDGAITSQYIGQAANTASLVDGSTYAGYGTLVIRSINSTALPMPPGWRIFNG